MNIRKITSLTLLLSFVPLLLTSIVLYVIPEGRVAYWSNWHWLGLGKSQWGDIHITLGFLFLTASLLHLTYNWKAMIAYMKNKARELRIFTPSFLAALLLTLAFIVGTLLHLPPFTAILDFGHSFKVAAAEQYGEPPYGHAELSSLPLFAKRTGLSLETMKAGLTKAGIHYTGDKQTILAIAQDNGITPKAVYEAMNATSLNTSVTTQTFPDEPFPGMGRMVLQDLCRRYGLDQQRVIAALAAENIKADPEKSLKEIAGEQGTNPHALFEIIHDVAVQD